MKSLISLLIAFSLLSFSSGIVNANPVLPEGDLLKIQSAPEINSLTNAWLKEYGRVNPDFKFSAGSGKIENISSADLTFIAGDPGHAFQGPHWKMAVAHNALIGLYNSSNPLAEKISLQGVSSGELLKAISGAGIISWSELIEGGGNKPVKVLMKPGESYLLTIPAIPSEAGASQPEMKVTAAGELVSEVLKDPDAIAFCLVTDIMKDGKSILPENVKILPVDRNNNGRLDSFEHIFDNPESLLRGIWIGKYPHELCGSIYAVSASKPEKSAATGFLSWVMNEGGRFLAGTGYTELASVEKQSNLLMLAPSGNSVTGTSEPFLSGFLLIAIILVTGGLLVTALAVRLFTSPGRNMADTPLSPVSGFSPASIAAPRGLWFDKTHTWAFMEKDGMVRVGIDDFIQHVTGQITSVKLREPGESVRRGEKILTIIREGKQLNMYAPVSGTIKSQNTSLYTDSSIINISPYNDGWIYLIEPANWLRETQFMLMAEKYIEWISEEYVRLKEFLAGMFRVRHLEYSRVILQDGGELSDNVLSDLSPEIWEDFQTSFIDSSK